MIAIFKELRNILVQDNVINLAMAVIFGGTFSHFINSIVTGFIIPIISRIIYYSFGIKLNYYNFLISLIINNFIVLVSSLVIVYLIFIKPAREIKISENDKRVKNLDKFFSNSEFSNVNF